MLFQEAARLISILCGVRRECGHLIVCNSHPLWAIWADCFFFCVGRYCGRCIKKKQSHCLRRRTMPMFPSLDHSVIFAKSAFGFWEPWCSGNMYRCGDLQQIGKTDPPWVRFPPAPHTILFIVVRAVLITFVEPRPAGSLFVRVCYILGYVLPNVAAIPAFWRWVVRQPEARRNWQHDID